MKAERLGGGRFAFQAAEGTPDFFIMISHPGFLRAFQAGPFGKDDVARGTIDIELPKPGTVTATFTVSLSAPAPSTGTFLLAAR